MKRPGILSGCAQIFRCQRSNTPTQAGVITHFRDSLRMAFQDGTDWKALQALLPRKDFAKPWVER
jgi:hypothetical protein